MRPRRSATSLCGGCACLPTWSCPCSRAPPSAHTLREPVTGTRKQGPKLNSSTPGPPHPCPPRQAPSVLCAARKQKQEQDLAVGRIGIGEGQQHQLGRRVPVVIHSAQARLARLVPPDVEAHHLLVRALQQLPPAPRIGRQMRSPPHQPPASRLAAAGLPTLLAHASTYRLGVAATGSRPSPRTRAHTHTHAHTGTRLSASRAGRVGAGSYLAEVELERALELAPGAPSTRKDRQDERQPRMRARQPPASCMPRAARAQATSRRSGEGKLALCRQ